ncbi:MAG: lipid-A-disaccharide synthase [Magnetococcales bacterium]|nr:lipid-A-disaccharide synthase [Magnetococcales bacterium]
MSGDRRPLRIMLVAGEASGDALGGGLLADLRERFPGLEAFGVGGERMMAQGLRGLGDVNDLSVIGLVEVIRRLPGLVRMYRRLVDLMRRERPDLLVTIDLPDFNFLLAQRAKALGIPRIHYVGPQLWAWRRGRLKRLARLLDHVLLLLPFEAAYYVGSGLPVSFVGHPLALRPLPDAQEIARLRADLGLAGEERLVVLLPGSRLSELKRHLAIMVAAALRLEREGGVRCALALADTLLPEDLGRVMAACPDAAARAFLPRIAVRRGETRLLLAAADAAMVASGTATLEAALIGTPMTVMYRVNWLTYQIGRRVIRVAHIALPNLVAGRTLVPERIQDQARPEVLAEDVRLLLRDPECARRQREGFREIRQALAIPSRSAGEVVADWLSGARGA